MFAALNTKARIPGPPQSGLAEPELCELAARPARRSLTKPFRSVVTDLKAGVFHGEYPWSSILEGVAACQHSLVCVLVLVPVQVYEEMKGSVKDAVLDLVRMERKATFCAWDPGTH